MANYHSKIKSNNFKVKDADAFKELMESCIAEDVIEFDVSEDNIADFACDGCFFGCAVEDGEDYELFIEKLQGLLDKDAVCVIKEIGWEKLRYLVAEATIITHNTCTVTQLDECVEKVVKEEKEK